MTVTVSRVTEAQRARIAAGSEVAAMAYELSKKVREEQIAYNAEVERKRQELRLDPDVVKAELARFANSEAAQAVRTGEQAIDAWEDSKVRAVQQIRDGVAQYGEQGRERRDHAREAAKLKIDKAQEDNSGRSTVKAISEVIANANPDELPVIAEFVPAYAETLGFPTDFIESAIADRVPALKAAQADLENTRRDAQVARHDLGMVSKWIEKGQPGPEQALVDPNAVRTNVGDQSTAVR